MENSIRLIKIWSFNFTPTTTGWKSKPQECDPVWHCSHEDRSKFYFKFKFNLVVTDQYNTPASSAEYPFTLKKYR